jgi:hypothetical protein
MIYICAYLSVFMLIGHLAAGMKMYLKPMLESNTEEVAKNVMHAVFHYMTIVMLLSAVYLVSFAHNLFPISLDIVRFIGIFYLVCGLTQMVMAISTNGMKGLMKMFQWTMFLPIGILAILVTL